jgi:hypothetical protein
VILIYMHATIIFLDARCSQLNGVGMLGFFYINSRCSSGFAVEKIRVKELV